MLKYQARTKTGMDEIYHYEKRIIQTEELVKKNQKNARNLSTRLFRV